MKYILPSSVGYVGGTEHCEKELIEIPNIKNLKQNWYDLQLCVQLLLNYV